MSDPTTPTIALRAINIGETSNFIQCKTCGRFHLDILPHICGVPIIVAGAQRYVASTGWLCPRCRTVHAPWVPRCDCPKAHAHTQERMSAEQLFATIGVPIEDLPRD